MAGYKIEKNVPPPNGVKLGASRSKYPFMTMKVGDSFLASDRRPSQVSAAWAPLVKKHGMRFVSRSEAGGVRVWRVK